MKFQGVELCETKSTTGKAYKWSFANDKQSVCGFCDNDKPPTTKNKFGRWLSALANKPIMAGSTINPDDYIGKLYGVVVEPNNDNTGTKLTTFSQMN